MAGLSANGLTVRFGHGSGALTAVKGVDIEVAEGRTMGLVGESGSGKSTLGRAIVQLVKASAGQVFLDGRDVTRLSPVQVKEFRSQDELDTHIATLETEMREAAKRFEFEQAARLRDTIKELRTKEFLFA